MKKAVKLSCVKILFTCQTTRKSLARYLLLLSF